METSIRPALEADAPRIADLLDQLGYPQRQAWIVQRIRALDDNRTAVWVALKEARIVGFLALEVFSFFHMDGLIGRITSMTVDVEHQRSGIGRALVSYAEGHCLGLGCSMLEVTSGLQRANAHAFYLRAGFEENSRKFIKRFLLT